MEEKGGGGRERVGGGNAWVGGRKGVGRLRKREKAPGLWGRGNARVGVCPGVRGYEDCLRLRSERRGRGSR